MCRVHFAETQRSSCVPLTARFSINEKHQMSWVCFASGVTGPNTAGVAHLHELVVKNRIPFPVCFQLKKIGLRHQWACVGDSTAGWRSVDAAMIYCG